MTKQNVMFPRNQCHGVRPIPLPEKEREIVRQLWPADRPTYWRPQDEALLEAVWSAALDAFFRGGGRNPAGIPGSGELEYGSRRGLRTALRVYQHAPVLPATGPPLVGPTPDGPRPEYTRVDVLADGFRSPGLMYCYRWFGLQRPAELSIDDIIYALPAHTSRFGVVRDEAVLVLNTFILHDEWGSLDD